MAEGELWWCGIIDESHRMPLNRQSVYESDLRHHLGFNQCNPLLLSNQGRYVYGEDYFSISVRNGVILLDSPGELILKEGFQTLREAYLDASGKFFPFHPAPPAAGHFLRPQYCTWIALQYEQNQEGVLGYCRDLLEAGFPAGELIIDSGWQRDYGDWEFDPGRFPDPVRMCREIREMGFSVLLWIVPYISPDSGVFRRMEADGDLVLNPAGEAFLPHWWDGYSAVMDFSSPGASKRMLEHLRGLQRKYGLAGFKMDGGDARLYRDDNRCFGGGGANEQSRIYASFAEHFEMNEIRSCCKCAGRPIVQRIADRRHHWGAETGLGGLTGKAILQGLSGYPYLCPDMIGGGMFTDFGADSQIDRELMIRYAQASALMPMMQFSYPVWQDPELKDICLDMAKLHLRFGPYILALAERAAKTGEPILRSMDYRHTRMPWTADQFMLGENVVAAPVLEKGVRRRKVLLPPGEWCYLSGNKVISVKEPFEVVEAEAPLEVLPYFERVTGQSGQTGVDDLPGQTGDLI